MIDPHEPVGKRWIDKEDGDIRIGLLKFKLWYPHVVVAGATLPLGKWSDEYIVNPAEDYEKFAKDNPDKFGTGKVPPIRGIVVESNCQFHDPSGPKNSVEGEIAYLRLERVADSKQSKEKKTK